MQKFEKIFPSSCQSTSLSGYKEKILDTNTLNNTDDIVDSVNELSSNKMYYFIREPIISPPETLNFEEYFKYKLLEGSVSKIKIKSFCYEGGLIVDGSFVKSVDYNEDFYITLDENQLRTIERI